MSSTWIVVKSGNCSTQFAFCCKGARIGILCVMVFLSIKNANRKNEGRKEGRKKKQKTVGFIQNCPISTML